MGKMVLSSGIEVEKNSVIFNIDRLINKVYKLLPMREQEKDWQKVLATSIEELNGMKRLIVNQDDLFVLLLCKMEGLFSLNTEKDMVIYRKIIFQCLEILSNLKENVS